MPQSLRLSRLSGWRRVRIPMLAAACGLVAGTTLALLAGQSSPLMAGAIMGGIVVAGAVIVFPELGLLLTAFVIPLERVGRLTDDNAVQTLSLMRFVGMLALGALLLHVLLKKWEIRYGRALWLYTAYFAFGAATVFFSSDFEGGVRTGGQVLGNLMFLFLIVNAVRTWRLAKIGVVTWLFASVVAGGWTVYNWHFAGSDRIVGEENIGSTSRRFKATMDDNSKWDKLESAVQRAQGTTSHPAVHGINMVMTLPFFIYLFRVHREPWVKLAAVGAAGVCLYNVMLTNTRAAILLAGIVVVLALARRMVEVTPGKLVAGLLAATCALYFVPEDIWVRVLDITRYTAGQNTGTLDLRFQMWEAAASGIGERPWFGHGMGNQTVVPSLVTETSPTRISAHNEYINTLLEVGIVGWLLMFGTILLLVRSSFNAARLFRRLPGREEQYWFMVASQLTLVSALLYGVQVDVFHFPLKPWWFVAGLAVALEILAREELAALAARAAPPPGAAPPTPRTA